MSAERCTNERCGAVTMCRDDQGPRCVECQQRDALIARWYAQAVEQNAAREPWQKRVLSACWKWLRG